MAWEHLNVGSISSFTFSSILSSLSLLLALLGSGGLGEIRMSGAIWGHMCCTATLGLSWSLGSGPGFLRKGCA